jgi:hypothetical protein
VNLLGSGKKSGASRTGTKNSRSKEVAHRANREEMVAKTREYHAENLKDLNAFSRTPGRPAKPDFRLQ